MKFLGDLTFSQLTVIDRQLLGFDQVTIRKEFGMILKSLNSSLPNSQTHATLG